jgi:uncharacterized protein YndB with AHSA1/START domain
MFEGRTPDVVVEAERRILAPPDVVFATFVDDGNFFELRPNAIEHRDVVPLPTGGHACTQVYEIRGRPVAQHSTTVAYRPGELIVDEAENEAGDGQRATATFAPAPGGTLVRLRQEMFPTHRANWLARRAINRHLETALAHILDRLAALVVAAAQDEG